jgi:ABC-type polysaccharide/polyol phosphate export permease
VTVNESRDDTYESDDDGPAVLGAAASEELTKGERHRRRQHRRKTKTQSSQTAHDGYSGIEMVYESSVNVIPPLREYLSELWARRSFLAELSRSRIRGARSSTALGSVWAILDPLFMAGLYFFIFLVIREGARPSNFILTLVSGIMLFQLSTSAMTEGGNSIKQGKMLMLNSTFPRALLPLATVYTGVLKFLPAVIVIAAAALLTGSPITGWLAFFPLLFLTQILINLGLALLTATIVVFIPDAKNLLQYITRILFFITPVIYPHSFLPENIRRFLVWQPFFGIFSNYQNILNGEELNWALLAGGAAWAVGFVTVGGLVFIRYERSFASRL